MGSSRRQKASFGCRAIGVLLLATAAFAAAVVLAPNQARSADGATATFVDAVGDAGGAPDLSTATVTEDATGTLSFVITASGFSAAPLPGGWNGIDIYLDGDATSTPGDGVGNEYQLRAAYQAGMPVQAYLFHYVSGSWQRVNGTSLAATGDGDTVTLTVAATDIGVTGAFRFYAVAGARDSAGNVKHWDYSPDHGSWLFPAATGETLTSTEAAIPTTTTPPSTALVIGSPATQPAQPVAGGAFTVAFSLSVAGADATRVKAVAHARVGGVVLRATTRVTGGSAVVSLRIPTTAAGRRLTLAISASTPTAHATYSTVFAIAGRSLATAALSSASTANGAVSFTDPTGDTPSGPDITGVTVSSTASQVQFDVTLTGSLAIGADGEVDVYIDADQNVATGSPLGAEYDIGYVIGDPFAEVGVWKDDEWQSQGIALADPLGDGKTTSLIVDRQDIGDTPAFGFYVLARSYPSNGNQVLSRDDAPDVSWWQYAPVAQTPEQLVKPVVGDVLIGPPGPVAGKAVPVAVAISRSDDGGPMSKSASGLKWQALAAVGNTEIATKKLVYRDGVLRFTLDVPRTAAGKTLAVAVAAGTCCQESYRTVRATVRRG